MKILITGATSGIGRQLALDYLAGGHEIWAVGRNREALAELAAKGMNTGCIDLADREQSLAWFAKLNALDLAILNAGICEYIELPVFDSASFCRVIRANVESMAISIEGVLPPLRQGSNPHLVGVSSLVTYLPLPKEEAYGASKAAITYLFETLRITLSKENICVSLINPGFVRTPMTDHLNFPMPFIIGVERASSYIRTGIARRRPLINFPKRSLSLVRTLACLPNFIWRYLALKLLAI